MEEWRDIELYPNYQVSNLGNVRSVTHIDSMGRVKKGQNKNLKKHPKGYLVVVLNHNENVLVHRLVANTFLGNAPCGHEVNHKDGNKQNNCVENLEWVTKSENQRHRYLKLKAMPKSQLSEFKKRNMEKGKVRNNVSKEMLESSMTLTEISKKTGVSISTISRMRNGK